MLLEKKSDLKQDSLFEKIENERNNNNYDFEYFNNPVHNDIEQKAYVVFNNKTIKLFNKNISY
jgi:hypothetical protein